MNPKLLTDGWQPVLPASSDVQWSWYFGTIEALLDNGSEDWHDGKTDVEILFEQIDNITETVQQYSNETYLDSLAVTLEVIFINIRLKEWTRNYRNNSKISFLSWMFRNIKPLKYGRHFSWPC